jgi:hypothetical protein
VLDGVYVRDPATEALSFRKLPAPAKAELEAVLGRTVKRIYAFLERRGCIIPYGAKTKTGLPQSLHRR